MPFPFRGSFAVHSGDHFRSWDHLRSNLGIICGTEIICGPVQISKAPSSKSYTCFFCRHEHKYPNQLQCISDCAIYRKNHSKHYKSNDVFIMQQCTTVGYVYMKSSTEVYRNSVHCCNRSFILPH